MSKINSTSFALEITEHFNQLTNDLVLKRHQQFVVDYLKTHSGLLVKHDLGTGKSLIMAALLAEQLNQVILLSAKSLHSNTQKAIDQYSKLSGKEIKTDYAFVTMNASNMIEQINKTVEKNAQLKFGTASRLNLDNKVLIIDEAHNLFNSITNGSKNAVKLYDAVMRANNLKVIFMTGTPIVNHPFELVPCYNMIARKELLPPIFEDFNKFFIDEEKATIKNREKFQNRIVGLTSYYGDAYVIEKKNNDFPESLPIIVEQVPMSEYQMELYSIARDAELREMSFTNKSGASLQKPKGQFSSSYKRLSRQFSNIVYPRHAIDVDKKRVKLNRDMVKPEDLAPENMEKQSPKWLKILNNIINPQYEGKHLLYSAFVESGVDLFAEFLKQNNWNEHEFSSTFSVRKQTTVEEESDDEIILADEETAIIGGKEKAKKKLTAAQNIARKQQSYTFIRITGNVAVEDRQPLIDIFNNDNSLGENVKLIIISGAGAEGLDLKCVRYIHIMEPYWNWMRILQIIGRGVRYLSHVELPLKMRTVQPIVYLSDYPKNIDKENDLYKSEKTTDVSMYIRALKFNKLINSFYYAIAEASIDCAFHNRNPKLNCRICTPTGEPLYLENINKDMLVRSPCIPMEREEITAEEYIIDDKRYAIHEGIILEFRPELNGFIELARSDPNYPKLFEKFYQNRR